MQPGSYEGRGGSIYPPARLKIASGCAGWAPGGGRVTITDLESVPVGLSGKEALTEVGAMGSRSADTGCLEQNARSAGELGRRREIDPADELEKAPVAS